MNLIPKIPFYLISLLTVFLFVLGNSCRKDFEYPPSEGNLAFSKDTVYLDTIFSGIVSSTYSLKIYNRTETDIEIPSIRLTQGQQSKYRLNVDGRAGKEFSNIPIFARDSIFIFIETTIDISNNATLNFLYTDAIEFDSGVNAQKVQLVTLVKDAHFLYPKKLANGLKETINFGTDDSGNGVQVEGFFLEDDELEFTREKPYVIYGYATVAEGKELLVQAGARIHFHKNSGILVKANASLKINGTLSESQELLENEVIFEGDRLQSNYKNLSGQWGTIWLSPGSKNNSITHATIKNATVGLLAEGDEVPNTPTLTIKNSQIYNSTSTNLWAKNAIIRAENLVLGSAGNTSLFCNSGGDYVFTHCTIANYWSASFRTGAALQIDNFDANTSHDLIQATFTNCIIDGDHTTELLLNKNDTNSFNYSFKNCLLTFNTDANIDNNDMLYDFQNEAHYQQLFLNQNVDFIDVTKNNFEITTTSAARNKANEEGSTSVPYDILGQKRISPATIGAYEN